MNEKVMKYLYSHSVIIDGAAVMSDIKVDEKSEKITMPKLDVEYKYAGFLKNLGEVKGPVVVVSKDMKDWKLPIGIKHNDKNITPSDFISLIVSNLEKELMEGGTL